MEQPGFQTASANDTDNQETNTGDGMRIESNRDAGLEVSPTAGDGRSVGGQIVSKPQMEGQAYVEPACINNNNNNNSSRDSKPDESVSEKSDEQAGRRMSDTGAERANKWRLNRARRGDRSRAQAEEFRANSISQLTSDIETSANNDDDENNRSTEQQQQQQQGAGSVNVEHKETSRYLASQSITDNSTNWRLPTALRPPPDIRIHVDTCEDLLESFPPHYQLSSVNENEPIRLEHHEFVSSFLQAFDQPPIAPPPTRSSSSVDLTTLSGGYDTTRDNRLGSTSCWGDQSLVSSRSVSNMLTSSEQDLLLLSVQTQDAGSLSDGAYKLTKYRRPNQRAGAGAGGELLASGLQHNKRRFENWKRNNKLMTNAHDNPFNLYMDCLERLDALNTTTTTKSDLTRQASNGKSVREQTTQTMESEEQPQQQQQQQRQPNDLSNYANNLTHLYRKNRESMDSSHDFRTLLYDIICCLLVQDEQVLSTVSVGKMLDVIRTHLDTASRVYAETSNQLLSNLAQQLSNQQQNDQRTAATSSSSSSSSGVSVETLAASSLLPCRQQQTAIGVYQVPIDGSGNEDKRVTEREESTTMLANDQIELASLQEPRIGCTRNHQHHQKPADFRRISSVSFNDEQLINDLRDQHRTEAVVRRSDSLSNDSSNSQRNEPAYSPSPWAYRELSDRRQSGPNTSSKLDSAGSSTSHTTTAHYTSQSSLEQTINNSDHNGHHNDPMNDSGNGTMCDSQAVVSDGFVGYSNEHQVRCRGRRGSLRSADRTVSLCSESFAMISMPKTRINFRKERRLSDFRPMQQPSYMSTDDYLSTTNNNNHNQNNNYHQRTSFYDDDNNSSTLQKCDMAYSHRHHLTTDESLDNDNDDCPPPIDVAGRRAELEWTLNKLINIELKLTWLTSKETLRRAIRKIGVPNEIRGKVWLILIDQMIGTKYDIPKLIELARQTIEQVNEKVVHFDDETQAILKQIELDVNRTMPGHRLFDDGAEGGVKLRRILVAYSIHVNRAIAYCQGFNFIVALLLSVFEGDEMNALRGFICIVDHIFPSKYYFDHYLTGARADQFLLADFICDQLIKSPTMAERKMVEGVTSSITLNWFISLFHGAVPTLTRLTILDHFMLEGVKALFRFTMAILYLAFQVTPPSSCDIFTTIRNTAKDLYDIKLLLSIVDQIKLPKDSYFAIRRSFYMVQSSFNSDQFYMQTLSNEAGKRLMANKPLSCQQLACATKPPALSLISSASFLASATNSFCNHHQQQDQQLASLAGGGGVGNQFALKSSLCHDPIQKPRTRISSDRTKICIQSIGKLGRSHLRIIDANARSNERSLMSPLRNCTLIGITNCGRNLIIARQSAKRNFRSFRVQDLTFHVHEISTEIFDGFYLEETQQALIITHPGEIFKIDCRKCLEDSKLAAPNYLDNCTETLLLRDSGSGSGRDCEKVKLRLATMDSLTNLLWIYVEYEGALGEMSPRLTTGTSDQVRLAARENRTDGRLSDTSIKSTTIMPKTTTRFRFNNPFMDDLDATKMPNTGSDTNNRHNTDDVAYDMDQSNNNNNMKQKRPRSKCDNHHQAVLANKPSFLRKIIIVDIITFDLFSVFAVHPNFGEITNLRASLVAFCQLSNPMSNQFSTRIVQIGPTGRYEQLLSFSDVADYMVNLPDSFKKKYQKQSGKMSNDKEDRSNQQQRYSSLKRFLTHSISFSSIRATSPSDTRQSDNELSSADEKNVQNTTSGTTNNTLTRYYRSLMKSYSSSGPDLPDSRCSTTRDAGEINKFQKKANLSPTSGSSLPCDRKLVKSKKQVPKLIQDGALRSIIASSFGDFSELSETNYIPVNMAFIFRNGKIALFEFTESYAIHTREAQLDRYDYSRVVDVAKNGEDFIVTILTVCDKLIKVII